LGRVGDSSTALTVVAPPPWRPARAQDHPQARDHRLRARRRHGRLRPRPPAHERLRERGERLQPRSPRAGRGL